MSEEKRTTVTERSTATGRSAEIIKRLAAERSELLRERDEAVKNLSRCKAALSRIANEYQSTGDEMEKSAKHMGLDLCEYLEMAYDNMQSEARFFLSTLSPSSNEKGE